VKALSGSTIKSWFQYRCERKTRYEIMDPSELAAVPVAKDDREKSWAVVGVDYENRVVRRLSRECSVLHPPFGDPEGLNDEIAAAFLAGRGGARFAAQLKLRPDKRPSFLGEGLGLRRSFADLIEREVVGGIPRFTVIDIKATRSARAFHKTQVAFYALLLEAVLAERGLAGTIAEEGAIWHIPEDASAEGDKWEPDTFLLEPYRRLVRDFCLNSLPAIADRTVVTGRDDTFFHVYFKCEQCSYLPHCLKAISPDLPANVRDISAVAGLSHEAKRNLLSLGARSVGSLAQQGSSIAQRDGAGWSLARRAETLIARAKALRDDEVGAGSEPHSFLMPPKTDVSLYLVADHDPVDDGLVTLGYLYVDSEGVRETIEVLPGASRSAEADALVKVFTQLIADLGAIDSHNRALEESGEEEGALYAHIFVFEPAEVRALQDAVKRNLDDERIRNGLLDMVRLFPPEDIVPEPEFRGMQHLPATALRSVVEQLFAHPVSVSYDLLQVSVALALAGKIALSYEPAEPFARPFSSLLSIDVARALREGKAGAPKLADIEGDVRSRLQATRAIAEWLRSEHSARIEAGEAPMLRLNKLPFRFQASFDPLDAEDLDVLRAFELLENRSGLLETLIRLARPKRVRRDSAWAIGPMRLLSVHQKQRFVSMYFKMPPEALDADIAAGALGLILSDGEPDFVLEPRIWSQISCQMLDSMPGDSADFVRIRVYKGTFDSPAFQEARRRAGEDGWWLDQSFVDLNSAKAEEYLAFLAEGDAQ
jgi:hypothetical protein